jgi:hypothetical protein
MNRFFNFEDFQPDRSKNNQNKKKNKKGHKHRKHYDYNDDFQKNKQFKLKKKYINEDYNEEDSYE